MMTFVGFQKLAECDVKDFLWVKIAIFYQSESLISEKKLMISR